MENNSQCKNHTNASINHESKKRKIDEVISDNCEYSTEAVRIKQDPDSFADPSIEIIQVGRIKNEVANEVIDVDTESDEDNTTKSVTTVDKIKLIPMSRLKKEDNLQESEYSPDQSNAEAIRWNGLLAKIGEFETKVAQKLTLEMSALKKSWEENNCKCKFAHKQAMDRLTSKIDKLQQENQQTEEHKQLLIQEKTELQRKLEKEREFRLELSEMLNKDVQRPEKVVIVKSEPNDNDDNNNNRYDEKMLRSPSKIKEEKAESQKAHVTHERKITKDPKPGNCNGTLNIPKFIRDEKPRRLSPQRLADEIRERGFRRYNIIVRGMKYSGANLYDEITNLLWLKTKTWPNIVDYANMESCLVLQMASLSNKYAILSRRSSLRCLNITIHNDLTARENQVQNWMHDVAKDQEKLRKKVAIRFLKIKVDGQWWVWDERKGDLVKNGTRAESYDYTNDTYE